MADGKILVQTSMAGRSLPLPGVKIEIYDGKDNSLKGTYLTNPEGKTVLIDVTVPEKEESLNPENSGEIFGVYNILATSKGFYSVAVKEVQVFAGQSSILYVNMVPLPQGVNDGENIFVVPPQNL